MSNGILKPWIRRLPALAAVGLALAALLVVQLWPEIPRSWLQWFLLFTFGPPLYLLGEAFFEWLFSASHGRAISARGFSVARTAIALPVVLALLTLSWWLSSWLTA